MNQKVVSLLAMACCAAGVGRAWALESGAAEAALAALRVQFPDAVVYQHGPRLTRVARVPLATGASPEQTAAAFVVEHAEAFGVLATDLQAQALAPEGPLVQPVMYLPDLATFKFMLVRYRQECAGIPVFASDLRLLMRNDADYRLVLVASSTRNLGSFALRAGAGSGDPGTIGHAAAVALVASLVNFTPSQWVVWAGVDELVSPVLAVQFVADNGLDAQADYQKWLFLADASTGAIVYQEDQILNVDVTGTVSGKATGPDAYYKYKADICNDEPITRLPYALVTVGSTSGYADDNGYFTIGYAETFPVTVESRLRGRYFRVYNLGGADALLTVEVYESDPTAHFIHNEPNTSEFNRAEVNGYLQANIVRDFILSYNPSFPVIDQQTEFPVKLNRSDHCNAWYDFTSIIVLSAGEAWSGVCPNTAFSTVIYHEYGHHAVECAGNGPQGAYGEGMGDSLGVIMTDDPVAGYGFYSDCDRGLRDARELVVYPCSGEVHACGVVLSGCIWSTRNELIVNYPATYSGILANLTINSIPLHRGGHISPQITVDFLVLDDDDPYLSNGTPHSAEICAGFGAHNMDCPAMATGLFVTPETGLVSDGLPGGPFTPNQITYRLQNLSAGEITYAVTKNPAVDWLDLSSTGGTIEAHAEVTVTLTINAQAGSQPYGTHACDVEFTSTAGAGDTTRHVELNVVPYLWRLDVAPEGWTTQGQWQFGAPLGLGGAHGCPDPTAGATGDNVYGVNLNGDYLAKVGGPYYLTTNATNLGGLYNCRLRFQRWLNADHKPYAAVKIEVSTDGLNWGAAPVWSSDDSPIQITGHGWSAQTYGVPQLDNQPSAYIRWGYQNHLIGTWAYSGWNIDDIVILAEPVP